MVTGQTQYLLDDKESYYFSILVDKVADMRDRYNIYHLFYLSKHRKKWNQVPHIKHVEKKTLEANHANEIIHAHQWKEVPKHLLKLYGNNIIPIRRGKER